MRRLDHSPAARADLIDIWLYIGAENPRAADRVLDSIDRRLQELLQHPYAGLLRDDVGPGVRRVVIGRYLAFYRVSEQAIEVLRVLHGKRQIDEDALN